MYKRAGTIMLPGGITHAKPGSLAVLCPACPQDGTLPESDDPLLNTLFIMLDGNLRMKCKDRSLVDPSLAPGLSYFVEESSYKTYLSDCGPQKEVIVLFIFWLGIAQTDTFSIARNSQAYVTLVYRPSTKPTNAETSYT